MSMTHTGSNDILSPEDAFQVAILVNAEMAKNVLMDRNQHTAGILGKRRRNLIKSLDSLIEAINQTYKGRFPEEFIKRAETYYTTTEAAMTTMLKAFKSC